MNGIPIEQAESIEEIFYSVGVASAIEAVFKNKPFPHGNETREYAEVVRAYFSLRGDAEELFLGSPLTSAVPSEVPADVTPKTTQGLHWSEEAMDLLFRRVILGIKRVRADFDLMSAIRAFDKRRGLFSSNHASSHVGEEEG